MLFRGNLSTRSCILATPSLRYLLGSFGSASNILFSGSSHASVESSHSSVSHMSAMRQNFRGSRRISAVYGCHLFRLTASLTSSAADRLCSCASCAAHG